MKKEINEEEKKQEEIEKQKQIEKQNEENVNGTIYYMCKHIDADQTKEYFKFMKEKRKLKAKIAKKKEKIARNGALDEAYLEKKSKIKGYYARMNEAGKNTKIGEVIDNRWGRIYIYTLNNSDLMETISDAENNEWYIEQQRSYSRGDTDVKEYYNDINRCLALQELIQKHYNKINFIIMKAVLNHYSKELEYWREYLKKLEELEEVKELE